MSLHLLILNVLIEAERPSSTSYLSPNRSIPNTTRCTLLNLIGWIKAGLIKKKVLPYRQTKGSFFGRFSSTVSHRNSIIILSPRPSLIDDFFAGKHCTSEPGGNSKALSRPKTPFGILFYENERILFCHAWLSRITCGTIRPCLSTNFEAM